MNNRVTQPKAIALALGLALASPLALADHNSIWGEGWATDAQGMHSDAVDRIEELGLGTDDSQAGQREISVQGTPRGGSGRSAMPGGKAETAATTDSRMAISEVGETGPEEGVSDAEEPGAERERAMVRVQQRYGTGYENRMERPERGERPERAERPQRPDRPETAARPDRPERPEQSERPQRPERPEPPPGR